MSRPLPERFALLAGFVTIAVLLALIVPAWIDYAARTPPEAPAGATGPFLPPMQPGGTAAAPEEEELESDTGVPVQLVLTASRGDSWISVRSGGAAGELLYQGILALGDERRFDGERLWLRLGASSNVDLRLNGVAVADVPPGTVDVVVTPDGVRPA